MTGTAFWASLKGLTGAAREAAILAAAVERGDGIAPTWIPISLAVGGVGEGPAKLLELDVAADYFAIGTPSDPARIPAWPATYQAIADRYDAILPTRRLVDAIWKVADVILFPRPLTAAREDAATFEAHNAAIEKDLAGRSGLIAGHKKDVVLSPRVVAGGSDVGRVAIYGWHRPDGTPWQPLSTIHDARYTDYSHGARLVRRAARLDGAPVDLVELLRDPKRARYVSDEGPIDPARYPPDPLVRASAAPSLPRALAAFGVAGGIIGLFALLARR